MKNINKKICVIFSFFCALIFASCSTSLNDYEEKQYGSLILTQGDRALDTSVIEKADLSLIGTNIVTKSVTNVDISGGAGTAKITGIEYGNNRAVKVEAKRTISNVLSKMAGVEMYAVVDINKAENTCTVNWDSSAIGHVYYTLIEQKYDVSNLERSTVQAMIPSVHASLVNTDLIASDIIGNTKKAASAYIRSAGIVKFNVSSAESGVTAYVCDPSSAKITSLSLSNTINSVAPGTWDFYVVKGGTVLYEKQVTVGEGATIDLGSIAITVPSPRLEDSTGKVISEFLTTSSAKVFLASRTYDDEQEPDGVAIYYTTNGTTPTTSSTKYTSAGITVSLGQTLRAIAVCPGLGSSAVASWTFAQPSLGNQHPSTGNYSVATTDTSAAYGATVSGDKTSFVLYSKNATKILLEIYSAPYGEANPMYDYWMTKDSSNNWRITLNGNLKNAIYAFRCWGPNWTYNTNWTRGGSDAGYISDCDSSGNRFNPNKVVYDPYAKELTHDKSNPTALGKENSGIYGTGEEVYKAASGSFVRRNFDTAPYASKAYVVNDTTGFGVKPAISSAAARVYEAHVRGLTKHASASNLSNILKNMKGFDGVEDVPAEYRGTYKGAAYMAKYFKGLGINTVEFLPVHESDNDCNPDDGAGGNYWAYMTYGYFAPDRRYSYDKSAGGPTKEFKEMVKAFHDEGIEVYLDVVYNHTGEGGPWYGTKDSYATAEITSMRGIDNSTYYALTGDGNKQYWETTGCGNNMQCDNPVVRKFVVDSLTYWITEMGVDGFRFDLAPVIGREKSGSNWVFNSNATTLTQIDSLGKANNVEMIAEAWDCQWPGGYQVGKFPGSWGDWNGVYRDVIREFVGGHGYSVTKYDSSFNYTLSASDAIYGKNGNTASEAASLSKFGVSVNMIVAHDGFTLADLSSYTGSGNALNGTLSWPFGPSDGGNGDQNYIPGSTADVFRRTNRNYIALQMYTRGIPMVVWGDEFSRTQNGNNNPYNIDSVATWNNYNMINTKSPHTVSTGGAGTYTNKFGTFNNTAGVNGNFVFMQRMLKMHSDPAFTQLSHTAATTTWVTGGTNSSFGFVTDGTKVGGHKFIMLTNQTGSEVSLTIPAPSTGYKWVRICDTGAWAEPYMNSWDPFDADAVNYYVITAAKAYGIGAYSTVIFEQIGVDETDLDPCEAPVITGTDMFKTSSNISIESATPGAIIYYTTDGTTPSAVNGLQYSGSFTISKTVTVKAIAVKNGYSNSSVVTKKFTKDVLTVADPVISGTTPFKESTTVTITCSTPGAAIYYTKDGSTPSATSTKYTSPISLTATTTIKAIGILSSYDDSEVATKTFSVQVVSSKSAVMLQGFTWNSAPRGDGYNTENPSPNWYKWYGTMKTRASDIKDTFDYVWFNPPSKCDSNSSEGYAPTQLNDLNSFYGSATELKEVIQAIQPAKAIADIVVNHRAGTKSWGDFTNPSWCDDYYAICSDDEGFSNTASPMYGSSKKGAPDTGAAYGAYRDLDHTNTAVQQGIIDWMNDVLKPAGFVGWRYDYVKGFGGTYVGKYNQKSSAEFAVGEYWPTDAYSSSSPASWGNEIKGWISKTETGGQRSKAFDFALKGALNDVFGCSWNGGGSSGSNNYGLLADSSNLYISQPADAVTFVDNHDTGSNQGHWALNSDGIGKAYALILTHPGVPCVAWSHYFTFAESGSRDSTYPYSGIAASGTYIGGSTVPGTSKTMRQHIDYLIGLRKEFGIEYDSERTTLSTSGRYAAEITGTNGSIITVIGSSYTPADSDYELAYSGTGFQIYTKTGTSTLKCKVPVISISAGKATITCSTAGATIKYGFSAGSLTNTYSSAVSMTEGQTIYAKAIYDGYEDSNVASVTYVAGKNLTITVDSWAWDDNAVIFAWVWSETNTGEWLKCSGSLTTVNVSVPADSTGFVLARCPAGTTAPDWDVSGNNPGRIYNKTADTAITSSTNYTVNFVSYTPY